MPIALEDVEHAKLRLATVLSQIFYSRGGLEPQCFRKVPLTTLDDTAASFDKVISQGTRLHELDKRALLDNKSRVIFRPVKRKEDNALRSYLQWLQSGVFPLLMEEQIDRLKVCFLRTDHWEDDALAEVFDFAMIQDEASSEVVCKLSWAGTTKRSRASPPQPGGTQFTRHLSQLEAFDTSIYTVVFTYFADGRPRDPGSPWHFDVDVSVAEDLLAQKAGFRRVRLGGIILGRRIPEAALSVEPDSMDLADDPIELTSLPSTPSTVSSDRPLAEPHRQGFGSRMHTLAAADQPALSQPDLGALEAQPNIVRKPSRLSLCERSNQNLSDTQPLMSQLSTQAGQADVQRRHAAGGDVLKGVPLQSHDGRASTVVDSSRQGTPAALDQGFLNLMQSASKPADIHRRGSKEASSVAATSPATKSSMGRGDRAKGLFAQASAAPKDLVSCEESASDDEPGITEADLEALWAAVP